MTMIKNRCVNNLKIASIIQVIVIAAIAAIKTTNMIEEKDPIVKNKEKSSMIRIETKIV